MLITPPRPEIVQEKGVLFSNPKKQFQFEIRDGTSDQFVLDQVFKENFYDLSGLKRWPEILNWAQTHKPFILDAGANIGATSIWFANQFPNAKILAVEPEIENFKALRRNTEGNPSIAGIQAAVASRNGKGTVKDNGNGEWGYSVEPGEGSVICLSIGDLIAGAVTDGLDPFIVKIDIEGGEKELFKSVSNWTDNIPIIFLEPHDWLYPKQSVSFEAISYLNTGMRDFLIQKDMILSIAHEFPK